MGGIMPDISMCRNEECEKNKRCYRFTAPPSTWQSYSDFKPDDKGECKFFMSLNKIKEEQ